MFPQLTLCFFSGTSAEPQVQERGRPGKGYFPAVPQRSDLQPGGLSGEVTWFTLLCCCCCLAKVGLLVKPRPVFCLRTCFSIVFCLFCSDGRSTRIRSSLSLFLRAPDRELLQKMSRKRPSASAGGASTIMAAEPKINLFHQQVRRNTRKHNAGENISGL